MFYQNYLIFSEINYLNYFNENLNLICFLLNENDLLICLNQYIYTPNSDLIYTCYNDTKNFCKPLNKSFLFNSNVFLKNINYKLNFIQFIISINDLEYAVE
jgi:hypothetical protein